MNFWYALSCGELLLQKNPITLSLIKKSEDYVPFLLKYARLMQMNFCQNTIFRVDFYVHLDQLLNKIVDHEILFVCIDESIGINPVVDVIICILTSSACRWCNHSHAHL